jgi:hypothetical protein
MTERLPRIRTLDFSPLLKGHQSRPPRSGANQSYLNIMEVKTQIHFAVEPSLDWLAPSPQSDLELHSSIRKDRTSIIVHIIGLET